MSWMVCCFCDCWEEEVVDLADPIIVVWLVGFIIGCELMGQGLVVWVCFHHFHGFFI